MNQSDSISVPQRTQFRQKLGAKISQVDKSNYHNHNAAISNNCQMRNIHVSLNAQRYPFVNVNDTKQSILKNAVAEAVENEANL